MSLDSPSSNEPRLAALFSHNKRRSLAVVVAFLLLAIFAAQYGSGIRVDTDLKALLPKDAPSVRALDEIRSRKSGSSENLTVAVKSPVDTDNEEMLEYLAKGIKAWPETNSLLTGRDFTPIRDRALDFLEEKELQELHDKLKSERQKAIAGSIIDEAIDDPSRLTVTDDNFDADFDDFEDEEPVAKQDGERKKKDVFDLQGWLAEHRETLKARGGLSDREIELIWPKEDKNGQLLWPDEVRDPYRNTKGDVRVLKATLDRPSTDVRFAQDIAKRIEELRAKFWAEKNQKQPEAMQVGVVGAYNLSGEVDAIMVDLSRATTLSGVLVLAVMLLGFRRPRALVLVALPMGVAMVLTLAFARAFYGELNALTGFLFAVLFGMGIDFSLHLYAQRERSSGTADWVTILHHHFRPLLATMATTAGCLLVLSAAEFKAFREFGVISAVGVAICFTCAVILVPALDQLLGGLSKKAGASKEPSSSSEPNLLRKLGRYRLALLLPLALLAANYIADVDLERDTRNLEAKRDPAAAKKRISGYGSATGRCSKTMILVGESAEDLNTVVSRFEEEKGKALPGGIVEEDEGVIPWVEEIYSVATLLPEHSKTKEELKGKIAQQASDFLVELPKLDEKTQEKRSHLEALEKLGKASPLEPSLLPDWAREPFVEQDGAVDRIAHLCLDIHGYNLDELSAVSKRVNELIGESKVQAADSRLIFSDLIRLVEHDARRLPLYALLVIALLLAIDLRKLSATAICFSSLALGLLVTFGAMGMWPFKVNFFNLVVIPAVVGLGIDASIHLWHARQSRETLGATAKASMLASLTTIAGFSGLLVASHPGLRSIGELGVLAITICVGIAFLALYPQPKAQLNRESHLISLCFLELLAPKGFPNTIFSIFFAGLRPPPSRRHNPP